jgi:flagellar M-ring protein FliF
MAETIRRAIGSSRQVWAGLAFPGRVLLVLVGGGVLVALLWTAFSTHRPDMTTLFSQLNPSDAGAIIEELKNAKIPYRIVDGGTTVLVPSGVVYETRLRLATKGVPQGGGIGFEIFDRTNLGMTDFVQRLNYQRALQGELARTIGQLKEVVQARVHLALPQPSVFTEQEKPPTASVVLHLRPGARPSAEQVRGIVHLVSSSVEGLNPDRVTVVDAFGKLVARPAEKGLGPSTTGQLEIKEAVESELEHRVQTMLGEILGPNKASVRVAAQMDFTSVERTEERFDPRGVIKSEQRTSESQQNLSTPSAGIPGVASNVPGQVPPPSSAETAKGKATKEAETIQYEVGKTIERKVFAPGQLRRISVAVLVDGVYQPPKDAKAGTRGEYIPRKAEELEKIKAAVKKAVGFDTARGDEVEVMEFPFDTSVMDKERTLVEEADRRAFWFSFVKPAVGALGVLLVLLFVVRPMVRALKGWQLPELSMPKALSGQQSRALKGGQAQALDEIAEDPVKHGLRELARDKPGEIAQLVRAWIVRSP